MINTWYRFGQIGTRAQGLILIARLYEYLAHIAPKRALILNVTALPLCSQCAPESVMSVSAFVDFS